MVADKDELSHGLYGKYFGRKDCTNIQNGGMLNDFVLYFNWSKWTNLSLEFQGIYFFSGNIKEEEKAWDDWQQVNQSTQRPEYYASWYIYVQFECCKVQYMISMPVISLSWFTFDKY